MGHSNGFLGFLPFLLFCLMGDEGGEFVVEVRHGSLCEGIRGDANKGLDDGYKLCSGLMAM